MKPWKKLFIGIGALAGGGLLVGRAMNSSKFGVNAFGVRYAVSKAPSGIGTSNSSWNVWRALRPGEVSFPSYAPTGYTRVASADTKSDAIALAQTLRN